MLITWTDKRAYAMSDDYKQNHIYATCIVPKFPYQCAYNSDQHTHIPLVPLFYCPTRFFSTLLQCYFFVSHWQLCTLIFMGNVILSHTCIRRLAWLRLEHQRQTHVNRTRLFNQTEIRTMICFRLHNNLSARFFFAIPGRFFCFERFFDALH